MSDEAKPKTVITPARAEARTARERRLAEALRANLKRRKDQSRRRAEDAETKESGREPGSPGDSD
jgi:hypothetical protein